MAAITMVSVALGNKLTGQVVVNLKSLGLVVRAVGSANFGAFIPVNIQPTEAVQHSFDRSRNQTRLVSVFNSDNELTAMMTSKKPVEEGCPDVADVGQSGGAGRESNADFSGHVKSPLVL